MKDKRLKSKHLRLSLVAIMMGVIFMFSNEPATKSTLRSNRIISDLSLDSTDLSHSVQKFIVRKSAHFILYLILGMLVYYSAGDYWKKPSSRAKAAILFCTIYAMSDEFHQKFVSGRSSELRDVLIDTAAATIGVIIFKLAEGKLIKRKSRP